MGGGTLLLIFVPLGSSPVLSVQMTGTRTQIAGNDNRRLNTIGANGQRTQTVGSDGKRTEVAGL